MDQKPKRKDINKYVKPYAADKWYDIGLELEVGDEDGEELDGIRKEHGNAKAVCFDAMIGKWLKETDSTKLTWRMLLDALESYGITRAVQAVKESVLGATLDVQSTSAAVPMELEPSQANPTIDDSDISMITHPDIVEQKPSGATPPDAKPIEVMPTESDKDLPLDDDDVVRSKMISRGLANDLPASIDGPPLPDVTSPSAVDFDLALEGGTIRGYQKELAELGLEGKNYIIVAPTGSGKTLVAALVISNHLQKGKENRETRKVAFIVEKRPLARQQTREIQRFIRAAKVSCCIGDESSSSIKSSLEEGDNIIVCTAGKLFDDIKCGRLALNAFSLLVFDECHHTRKKSPYAELMIRYMQMKDGGKLPQVFGLTASPGAGDNPHLEKKVTIDHLIKLCAHMDATSGIKTVQKHQQELEKHTNKPEYNVENSAPRDEREPFIVKIVEMMQKLEKHVEFSSPFERWSQKYETQVQQNKYVEQVSTDPRSKNLIRVWDLLRCLSRALDVYMELQYRDAVSVLEESKLWKLDNPDDFEKQLCKDLSTLVSCLSMFPPIENPHLIKVKNILKDRFEGDRGTMAMLFVRTKKHASSIYQWISGLPISGPLGIKPCMVVGQEGGTTGDGMTQAEQETSFKSFRERRSNVLVVTSIGEEGIDMPACNLVLRYQHVSNEIAKAQTLGRARATGTSEGYTILSSTGKQKQEAKNSELLELVDRILLDSHFPSGPILVNEIKKEQQKILKKFELEKMLSDDRKLKFKAKDVQLICCTCKTPACCGTDVLVVNGTSYVVPGDEFKAKIIMKKHQEPVVKAAMNLTHSIFCASCNQHWGVSCIWPSSGHPFPMLKCKSFMFLANNVPISVKKWSEAPFEIKPFEVEL